MMASRKGWGKSISPREQNEQNETCLKMENSLPVLVLTMKTICQHWKVMLIQIVGSLECQNHFIFSLQLRGVKNRALALEADSPQI